MPDLTSRAITKSRYLSENLFRVVRNHIWFMPLPAASYTPVLAAFDFDVICTRIIVASVPIVEENVDQAVK